MQTEEKPIKVYVDVMASFNAEGAMMPQQLTWEDGTQYCIDRVSDIRQAAAMKAGGQGDRYTITVNGKQSYLFFEAMPQLREITLVDGLLNADRSRQSRQTSMKGVR